MKKCLFGFLAFCLLMTGCASAPDPVPTPTPTPEPQPIGYSEPIYVVTHPDSGIETIADLEGKVICTQKGYGKESTDYVVSVLTEAGITFETYEITTYEGIPDVANEKEADAWIIDKGVHEILFDYRHDYKPANYKIIEEYQIPYFEEKPVEQSILNNPLTKKPFAVMITGLDERVDPSSYRAARNDVNHLMIVNPETKHVLTVSFPRDSYMTNVCTGYKDKMTHFGLKGTECVKDSVGELLGIEIDYFAQVSFSSFIDMINSLGGVVVDVPLDMCMDMDSYRDVSQPYCLEKGETLLYGEWALALARNRKYNGIYSGDEGRIRNQMLIINSIAKRIVENPFLLLMMGYDWRVNELVYHNFDANLNDIQALFYLVDAFSSGYTTDNYFIKNVGDYTESGMYIGRIVQETLEIAKLKIEYAMTGKLDRTSPYYEEAMLGYVSGGAGNNKDKYIGEEYMLDGYEPEPTPEPTPTSEGELEEASEEKSE